MSPKKLMSKLIKDIIQACLGKLALYKREVFKHWRGYQI
jgi:hypothetical protein